MSIPRLPHQAVPLDLEACWVLLAPGGIGRLALTDAALPMIVPARYELCDDELLVGILHPRDLRGPLDSTVVAFEADSLNELADAGAVTWFVHLAGRSRLGLGPSASTLRASDYAVVASITPSTVWGMSFPNDDAEP